MPLISYGKQRSLNEPQMAVRLHATIRAPLLPLMQIQTFEGVTMVRHAQKNARADILL